MPKTHKILATAMCSNVNGLQKKKDAENKLRDKCRTLNERNVPIAN